MVIRLNVFLNNEFIFDVYWLINSDVTVIVVQNTRLYLFI